MCKDPTVPLNLFNYFCNSHSLCPIFLSCKIVIKPVRNPTVSVGLSSAKHFLKEVRFYGKFSSRLPVPYLPLPAQFMPIPEVTETTSVFLIHKFLSSCVLQWNGLVFWILLSDTSPTKHTHIFSGLAIQLQQRLSTYQRSQLDETQRTHQQALSKHWGERWSFPYRVMIWLIARYNGWKKWTRWYGRVIPQ